MAFDDDDDMENFASADDDEDGNDVSIGTSTRELCPQKSIFSFSFSFHSSGEIIFYNLVLIELW